MPFHTRLRTLVLFVCVAAMFPTRYAVSAETNAANGAAARKHFELARTYYGQGAYRDAIAELEAAHALDPNAKDLVFNLGVVHEKLSDIDEALTWFRLYTTMALLPQERDRADAYVRRLEGAKRELDEKQAAEQRLAAESSQSLLEAPDRPLPTGPLPRTESSAPRAPMTPQTPVRGRTDALTIGAASLAAAGLLVGVAAGVKALADRQTSPTTTSGYSFDQLRSSVTQAHGEAVVADIGFSVALVAGLATTYLYLGRWRTLPATSATSPTVSVGPLSGGGALVVRGRF